MAQDLGGFRACLIPGCGARVSLREDRAGRVYYKCLGHHDTGKCGAEVKFGKQMGALLRAEIEAETKDDEPAESESAGRDGGDAETDQSDKPAEPEPGTGDEPGSGDDDHFTGL